MEKGLSLLQLRVTRESTLVTPRKSCLLQLKGRYGLVGLRLSGQQQWSQEYFHSAMLGQEVLRSRRVHSAPPRNLPSRTLLVTLLLTYKLSFHVWRNVHNAQLWGFINRLKNEQHSREKKFLYTQNWSLGVGCQIH